MLLSHRTPKSSTAKKTAPIKAAKESVKKAGTKRVTAKKPAGKNTATNKSVAKEAAPTTTATPRKDRRVNKITL